MRCYHFQEKNKIFVSYSDSLINDNNGYVCSGCGRRFTREEYEIINYIISGRIKRNSGIQYEIPARHLSGPEVKRYLEMYGLAGRFNVLGILRRLERRMRKLMRKIKELIELVA